MAARRLVLVLAVAAAVLWVSASPQLRALLCATDGDTGAERGSACGCGCGCACSACSGRAAPPLPLPPSAEAAAARARVLVLGSGGLIGSEVTRQLRAAGYFVYEVVNRTHIDLRVRGALDRFNASRIDFAFYFAAEVGGSKLIDFGAAAQQMAIVRNNLLMYETVLPWLGEHAIPFVFTSSYCVHQLDFAYGTVKRVAEQWIEHLPNGYVVRLWNVYGKERLSGRSHVIPDWIEQCRTKGVVHSLSAANEKRQYSHVRDVAGVLVRMMENRAMLSKTTEIAAGTWTSLEDLARVVNHAVGGACRIEFSDVVGSQRPLFEPNLGTEFHRLHWRPNVSLAEGAAALVQAYDRDRGHTH